MKVRDYFVSNPCRNIPISVPYVPCDHIIRQTHTTSWGFDVDCFAVYTDTADYVCTDSEDEKSVPCITLRDNSCIISLLEQIENFPDLPESLLEQLIKDYHIGNIELGHGYTYVPISALRGNLHDLYLLFICYRILVWGENLSDIDKPWRERLRCNAEQLTITSNKSHELCTDFMKLLIQSGIACNTSFAINDQGILQRMYECDTVDDALFYQLFLHIEAGEAGLNGYSLARCKRCGSMYPQATRKFSLCDHCREPRERTRACREKKKEAAYAQESNP